MGSWDRGMGGEGRCNGSAERYGKGGKCSRGTSKETTYWAVMGCYGPSAQTARPNEFSGMTPPKSAFHFANTHIIPVTPQIRSEQYSSHAIRF